MNQLNKQEEKDGYWEEYWKNGKLWHKGNYVNGEKNASWVYYDTNANIVLKKYYIL